MKIAVCIGSSCYVKGSHQIIEQLNNLINENNYTDKIELSGTFCLGRCQQGVCVTINDDFYSVTPESVKEFFQEEILNKLEKFYSEAVTP